MKILNILFRSIKSLDHKCTRCNNIINENCLGAIFRNEILCLNCANYIQRLSKEKFPMSEELINDLWNEDDDTL